MHKLLRLQLRKHFGCDALEQVPAALQQGVETEEGRRILGQLLPFLTQVDAAYAQFDRDVSLAHRGLVLSNQELVALYERQRVVLEGRERALAALRESARTLAGIEATDEHGDDLEALSGLVTRLVQEREEARVALVQAQKLESLGALAGGIAHDFNNLLVSIVGNLEMALLRVEADHPARPFLERMEPAAQRSADIVRQLLDYAGKGRLSFIPVNLNDLAREVASILSPQSLQHIELHYSLSREPLPIHGDAAQLVQALLNLVVNAVDAIGDGPGRVTLSSEAAPMSAEALQGCQVSEGEPGTYAVLHVQDTGCGMDEATCQRIFDPFFSTKAAGRGLGLAVLHGVLRSHGGAARIQSVPGVGTTFSLFLPVSEAMVERAAVEASAAPLPGPRKILIVDDEAPNLGVIAAFLEALEFQSEEATSGAEALERCRKSHFDAVLMDLSMPGMDGAETLQRLREEGQDLPVILMSGYSQELSTSRLEGWSVSGFLQKPFKLKDLAACLAAALPG